MYEIQELLYLGGLRFSWGHIYPSNPVGRRDVYSTNPNHARRNLMIPMNLEMFLRFKDLIPTAIHPHAWPETGVVCQCVHEGFPDCFESCWLLTEESPEGYLRM